MASQQLIPRRFEDTDLEPFLAYCNDPEVARYQHWDLPYGREQALTFIEGMRWAKPGTPGE